MRRDTVLVVPGPLWRPDPQGPQTLHNRSVSDLGTLAQPDRAPALRLSPELLNGQARPGPARPAFPSAESRRALRAWLATADAGPDGAGGVQAVKALRKANAGMRPMIVDRSSKKTQQHYVLRATSRGAGADSEPAARPVPRRKPVFLARRAPARRRATDRASRARRGVRAAGTPSAPICRWPPRCADCGKADPRFQSDCSAPVSGPGPSRWARSSLAAADHRGQTPRCASPRATPRQAPGTS